MVGYEIIPSSGFTSSGACLLSTGCKTGESVHASVVREDQEKNTFDEVSICWHKIILNYLVVRDKFLLRRQSLRLIVDPQVLQQI